MDMAKSEISLTHNSGHATASYLARAEPVHFVENVCPNPGFSFLVWKVPSVQFGADDHLPAAYLCFASGPVIVAAANLPC
jgi:hypothetical protein